MSTPQTPHASPTPHLDLDTQADLQEGLLDPQRAASVAGHLQGCAACRATRDALDSLRSELRDHGAEEASAAAPEDVVRRLDAALAAAAPPVATAAATVVPITAAWTQARSPWRTHVLQAAAVFVLVALLGGLGYGGIRALRDGSNTSGADTAASGGTKSSERAPAGTYRITGSGRDYTVATLRAAVPELLAGTLATGTVAAPQVAPESDSAKAGAAAGTPSAKPSPVNPERLRDGTALAACVANLANGPVTPLAVDVAQFEGKPATIIVLPDPADKSFVWVYAVSPDCATGLFLASEHVALP
jgi:hypothetical protein